MTFVLIVCVGALISWSNASFDDIVENRPGGSDSDDEPVPRNSAYKVNDIAT